MLLAIDTATRVMSIALHDENNLISEQTWQTPNRHTVDLAPAIHKMMQDCEVTINDITALGVSIGPGSYTGLRIGVAFAKGVAEPRGLPLVGISTLDTLAWAQPHYRNGDGLICLVQAGRGRIIVQSYRWRQSQWHSASKAEPQLMNWQKLINSIDGPALITGEIDGEGLDAIEAALQQNVPITMVPPVWRLRRAGFLAECAWERLRDAGNNKHIIFEASKLLPIYVQPEAVS